MKKALCFSISLFFLINSSVLAGVLHSSDHVNADLIAEVQSIQPNQTFSVGVLLKLEEGWHTYWLNPGDSGLPVAITWKLPPGFVAGDIQWPYPSRFGSDSVVNFGYEEEVLLITNIQAPPTVKQGEQKTMEADVEWLVCKEECLPGQAVLSLNLPVKDKKPTPNPLWKEKFEEARKKLPVTSQDWLTHAVIDKNHVFLSISSTSGVKNELRDIQFFPEQPELFNYSEPQLFEKTDNGYTIQVKLSALARKIPSKLYGILVSDKAWSRVSENRALRIIVPLKQQSKKIKTQKEVSR